MTRRTIAWCLPVLAAALVAGAWQLMSPSAARAADEDTNSLVGKPAPEIALTTLDDKKFSLAEQKGSVVVLDFWATWCPPCRKSLPHLNKISTDKELAAKGLKVFGVNAQETKEKAAGYLMDNKMTFTVPMDSDGAVMKAYLIRGIPTTIIVGRDGVIKNVFIGFGGEESEKAMDDAVAAALAEKK